MSQHRVTLDWTRSGEDFSYAAYDRSHTWTSEGGVVVPASAAPAFKGRAERMNPEEALVGALSSCHMLTLLALCSRDGLVVDRYQDDAVAFMERADDKKLWVARVVLRPKVIFAPGKGVDAAALAVLHHRAHEECFVARSVKTDVVVEPQA